MSLNVCSIFCRYIVFGISKVHKDVMLMHAIVCRGCIANTVIKSALKMDSA